MRILIADALPQVFVDRLVESGHECELNAALTPDDLPAAVGSAEALVVRSTKVTAATIDASDKLSLIVRAGAGTNNIDRDHAANHGICVCNVPGRNAIAVAELTMGLLLAIDRRIPQNDADLKAGLWRKKEYAKADGLFGRSMGILGLGNIGVAVAQRAAAFGLRLFGVARPGRSDSACHRIDQAGIELVESTEELLASCDIVSLHVPANAQTKGMVNAAFLSQMRDRSILLNTARGEVVDGEALLTAMNERGIRAGLDTYSDEPSVGNGDFHSALAAHPNVVGTHHIGASTSQAQNAIAAGVVETIESYTRGVVLNCVNMETAALGRARVSIRHFDRVGVLASVFDVLRSANLNVEQMENQIFAGSQAAVATMEVGGHLTDAVESQLLELENIISVSVHNRVS